MRAIRVDKLVCERGDRWVIKQLPALTEARSCAGMTSPILRLSWLENCREDHHTARLTELNTIDGTCLMNVSTVDLSAEDTEVRVMSVAHDAVRDQSLPWRKNVTWNASQRSRFRGRRT